MKIYIFYYIYFEAFLSLFLIKFNCFYILTIKLFLKKNILIEMKKMGIWDWG